VVCLAAAGPLALCRIARAQAYPSRPVRIVVGQSGGSGTDTAARLLAPWLSNHLGQPFVVDNQPGASGNVAVAAVVRAPADGYTLLTVFAANAINETLFDNLNFSFVRDIAPVAGIFRVPLVMVTNPGVPAGTVPEFVAYAKANPGRINMASPGIGSVQHVAGELFKFMTGVDMVHVPYRGTAPALTDLLAGQVQAMFDVTTISAAQVKAGRLRALAVTTRSRVDVLPDVPVMADFVPGYEASAWVGFGAPRDTPATIVDSLNRHVNAGLADPTIAANIAQLGGAVIAMAPDEFGRLIAEDAAKWARVIRAANIKVN
jgi:tripartite-type tricarboxylate transporter receptor subunit TctC